MKNRNGQRIAVFQTGYPVQSQTANCVISLAHVGYYVDLFLWSSRNTWNYVEREKLRRTTRVEIYDLRDDGLSATFHQYVNRLGRRFFSHIWSAERFLPHGVVRRVLELMTSRNYHCAIGMEKKGLIWAGRVAEKLNVPLIYYSLELYTDDYYRIVMPKSNYFKYLRLAECDYHRKASATIIQDPDRAQVLFHDNGMSMSEANIFYVPVSIIGEPYKNRSCFLHDALGIPKHKKVILYFGLIWEKRYALEVAQVAQNFPEDWVLVMHGYAENPSTLEKIKALDRRNRVVLSLELVPSNRIQELVASADIGLALYSPLLQNDRLTAFSSEKVALYMQCGVPFVAFDYPGYRRLANEERCGVVIRSLDDLPKANREILLSYDEFRRRAYQTFHKYYDYCRNFAKVTESVGYLRPASQLGSAALTGVGLTE